jgi:glyoxylase-like metal-dependent hydrolase (beta-lactamase superfamily II)
VEQVLCLSFNQIMTRIENGFMIQIGDITITPINDAIIRSDSGGPFGLVPRALWSRIYEADDLSRVLMYHNCLLVQAADKIIVVDTGIGTRIPDKMIRLLDLQYVAGGLVNGLALQGVKPEDVDLVINTHLHSDHCGGNTRFAEDGSLEPTFPNAEYITQRQEAADASFPNERTRGTYFADNFQPLLATGQMRLIDGDIEVLPGMRCVLTPGHTQAHMSITFEHGGAAALYVADMASLWVHFANLAWMTAYDVEPLVTLETKRKWQQWVLERDALVLFEHDPMIFAGRLVQDERGKLMVEPVTEF